MAVGNVVYVSEDKVCELVNGVGLELGVMLLVLNQPLFVPLDGGVLVAVVPVALGAACIQLGRRDLDVPAMGQAQPPRPNSEVALYLLQRPCVWNLLHHDRSRNSSTFSSIFGPTPATFFDHSPACSIARLRVP